MKAGSVGSSPNSTTTDIHLPPLSNFLKHSGEAVFSLNTSVVGLDAVENGYDKPAGLDISWSPVDRKLAARKSRKFILEAVLVRMSEALKEHTVALSKLPRFSAVESEFSSHTKATEKIGRIGREVLGAESYLVSAAVLLVHWRNRVVHRNTSKAKLAPVDKSLLRKYKDEIATKYKGLSIDCLLCHFEEQRPTLKDISSLIAMSINLARSINQAMYKDLDKSDLDAWLCHYGVSEALTKVRAETAPEKLEAAINRTFNTRAPALLAPYLNYYGSGPAR